MNEVNENDGQKVSKMGQFIIRHSGGVVRDQETADDILVGFSAILIFTSLFLLAGIGQGPNIPLPPGTKVVYSNNEPPRIMKPIAFTIQNEFFK